ncbi:MAG: phosphatase PAP2 family protein [Janthinobacterium lividum]
MASKLICFPKSCRMGTALCVLAVSSAAFSLPVQADNFNLPGAKFYSGNGNIIYLAAAVGLPLLRDGQDKKEHALRAADAIGTSVLLSEGLKSVIKEKRPDSNSHDSFPSGHATAAFAAAAVESQWHPKEAPYWYAGAALISVSRVSLNRHYTQDVVAGAALGYFTARLELSQRRGLILSPFISPHNGGVGLQLSRGL